MKRLIVLFFAMMMVGIMVVPAAAARPPLPDQASPTAEQRRLCTSDDVYDEAGTLLTTKECMEVINSGGTVYDDPPVAAAPEITVTPADFVTLPSGFMRYYDYTVTGLTPNSTATVVVATGRRDPATGEIVKDDREGTFPVDGDGTQTFSRIPVLVCYDYPQGVDNWIYSVTYTDGVTGLSGTGTFFTVEDPCNIIL